MSDVFDHEADAFDDLLFGRGMDEASGSYAPRNKCCKYCGVCGLAWGNSEGGWRLFTESGTMHVCEMQAS